MMANVKNSQIRGLIKYDEPMSKHTSWRVGGPAKVFFKPVDLDDLILFLQQEANDINICFLGLGSNLLVRDAGFNGCVIAMLGINQILEKVSETRIRVSAGVTCAKTARFCLQHNMNQAAFLAGIPGTMGGALAMNAGAFGGETWPYVIEVETLDNKGILRTRQKSEYDIAYRHVQGPNASKKDSQSDEWFVSALCEFINEETGQDEKGIKELLSKRNDSQPIGLPSCGSVFTNPDGDHAARLIEASDLKGFCIGKACVSEKHANFIINTGGAKAAEIEALIQSIQKTVLEKHDVQLSPEVRIIGNAEQS